METENITGKIKRRIFLGLMIPLLSSAAIGYGFFNHYHAAEEIQIPDAKVTGTLVSARTLVEGKISEILFDDGEEVRAGEVIARLEVAVTPESIAQLENTVALAKSNYEDLKLGQVVKVPVKRVRVIPAAPRITYSQPAGNSELASLEERANRMKELFEMGAVSRVQRDAAVAAYENARGSSSYSAPQITQGEPTYIEEIEYVDQWQPTPEAVLLNAENAIKQAELSLNVALQEAQETEVLAPVSGTIYYTAEVEKDLKAGNTIAKIGDSNELWLEAEVSEDIFNKVALGKAVDYSLAGYDLSGTVIEKIAPTLETAEIENFSEWIPPTAENSHPEFKTEKWIPPTSENPHPEFKTANFETQQNEPLNDKYILKFSLPAERDFNFTPNTTTTVKIKVFK